jgi:hypothetical protein
MPSILPEELLEHIFSYLVLPYTTQLAENDFAYEDNSEGEYRPPIERKNKTLFNVCLASKTFNRLAWPALYRTYSTWPSNYRDVCPVNHNFLRTLCQKPVYGNALQSLSITAANIGCDIDWDVFYDDYLSDDLLTKALFQWVARRFWFSGSGGVEYGKRFQKRLVRSLMVGLDEGVTCMILLLCPNIIELDIMLPSEYKYKIDEDYDFPYLLTQLLRTTTSSQMVPPPIGHLAEQPKDIQPWLVGIISFDEEWRMPRVLQKLEELTLRESKIATNNPLLPLFMSLPSLKVLRICRLQHKATREHAPSFDEDLSSWKTSSSITKLHLPECGLHTAGVVKIMPFFPKLTVLNISWDEGEVVAMEEIGRAISREVPFLQSLTLDTSRCSLHQRRGRVRIGDVLQDNLKDLQYLTKLKVSDHAIWSLNYQNHDAGEDSFNTEIGIQQSLPLQIEWLEFILPICGYHKHIWDVTGYERWQDHDLNILLKQASCPRLRRVITHRRVRELDVSSLEQSGWTLETSVNQQNEVVQSLRRQIDS